MEAIITVFLLIILIFSFIFIFFGGFGTLLILLFSFLYSLLTGFEIITPKVMLALGLIYLAGEIFDYVFIVLGAKISGAGKKACFGAILGGLIGAAISLASYGLGLFPLTLLGIFFGAFLVELKEKKDFLKAVKVGLGSLFGRLGAVVFKAMLGILMLGIIVFHIVIYLK